jgi:formate-nitrite transporter family protein
MSSRTEEAKKHSSDVSLPEEIAGSDPTQNVQLRSTFHRAVDEGVARTSRTWPDLISTGLMGGLDVSLGVLAMFVVKHFTGSDVLASLAFTIGFIVLTLAKSELFTENFFVPVAAVVGKKATIGSVLRLWIVTLVCNVAGAWFFAWLAVRGLPEIHSTALHTGTQIVSRSWMELFASGVIGGIAITLMTFMEHGSIKHDFSSLIGTIAVAFVLAAAHLNHVVVATCELFIGILTGNAAFGYVDWLRVAAIAIVSNLIGGVVLTTAMRLFQVGGKEVRKERQRNAADPRPDELRDRGFVTWSPT